MSKLPAMQFYPGDWLKDPALRRCSHSAKGIWIDILCLMHESEERGVLATAGVAWSDDDVAQAVGGDRDTTLKGISELTLKGVLSRNEQGAMYCRRMVRDEHKRHLCFQAGKRGGNPTLKGHPKGEVKGSAKGHAKRNPTPSSSSSTSVYNPPTPQGGREPSGSPIPQPLDTDAFRTAWERWVQHRKETRHPLKPTTIESQLKALAVMGEAKAIAAIEQSILNGWQGLFEPRTANGKPSSPKKNASELDASEKWLREQDSELVSQWYEAWPDRASGAKTGPKFARWAYGTYGGGQ